MAFNRKYFSNASVTGNDVNLFTYGMNAAADNTAAMAASGFFNEASDVLKKGNIILVTDGVTPNVLVVTSAAGVKPVTTTAMPIA